MFFHHTGDLMFSVIIHFSIIFDSDVSTKICMMMIALNIIRYSNFKELSFFFILFFLSWATIVKTKRHLKRFMILSTHWWTGNSSMLTQQETSPLDYCSARFQGGNEQKQKSYHCVHICSDWWSISLVFGDGKSSPWSACVALCLFWIGCLCSFSVAFS